MIKVVKVERMLQKKTGRKDKLTIEDQVLITKELEHPGILDSEGASEVDISS